MASQAANPDVSSGKAALPVAQKGLLTVGIMGAAVVQILDTTIANVALPHMQTSLGATAETVTWVLTSYIVASAIAIPLTGWLADRVGSRRLFLIAVGGFISASMLCGAATNLEEMVLFRMFQGICGAFIPPLSQTAMLDINPPEKQGSAMSIWGMGIMIGPILGPIVGGFLTESYNWRWCFYVNLPIGAVTFAILWALLPGRPSTARRFDGFGFCTMALALGAFQMMLDRGQQQDWFQSGEILFEAALCLAALWITVIHLASSPHPLFDRHLFTDRNFAVSLVIMLVVGVTTMAPMALLPPMVQQLMGYPVVTTGLVLAPRGVGVLVTMALAARLRGKVDFRYAIALGATISAASLMGQAHWSATIGWQTIVLSGFVQGLGLGLVFMPLNALAFATLAPRWRTDGASMMNLSRSIGASIGISVCTFLLARSIQTNHEELASQITAGTLSVIDPAQAPKYLQAGEAALTMVDGVINQQAAMIGYLNDFYLMAFVTACTAPLVFLLKSPKGPIEAVHMSE